MNQTIRSHQDLQNVFHQLLDRLQSTQCKLAPVKTSRWFSWHQACADQLNEWFAMRMLLENEYPSEPGPGDRKFVPNEGGGLKLALGCCSWRTWMSVKVLYIAGQPLWDWYTDTVKNIKTPQQGLERVINLACNRWLSDNQFRKLVEVLLQRNIFDSIGQYLELSVRHVGQDSDCTMDTFVQELFFYVLGLLERRAGSYSKMNCSPEVYSPLLLSENEGEAQATLDLLLSDWKTLVALEQNDKYQLLASDLRVSVGPVMRIVYQLFERGEQESALTLLRSLLVGCPDTKIIEDCHGKVRNDARANSNKSQTFSQIQQVILGSSVIESRRIPHPAALKKDVFKLRWKRTSGKRKWMATFHPKAEKLPKVYSKILGPKHWGTVSEESLQRSAAAWQLVRHFVKHNLRSKGLTLTASLISHHQYFKYFCCCQ